MDWQWTVYYDDGKKYTNQELSPEEAPPWGIQAIVQKDSPDSDTIVITAGDDFYYYDYRDERWYGVELTGLIDFLVHDGWVKLGRFIPITRYNQIMEEAIDEVRRRGE